MGIIINWKSIYCNWVGIWCNCMGICWEMGEIAKRKRGLEVEV